MKNKKVDPFKKSSMRHTRTGRVYLRLADRFDMSTENRKILNGFMDEPDNVDRFFGADLDWEEKVRALFSINKTDPSLFTSAMWGISRDERELSRQVKLN